LEGIIEALRLSGASRLDDELSNKFTTFMKNEKKWNTLLNLKV